MIYDGTYLIMKGCKPKISGKNRFLPILILNFHSYQSVLIYLVSLYTLFLIFGLFSPTNSGVGASVKRLGEGGCGK